MNYVLAGAAISTFLYMKNENDKKKVKELNPDNITHHYDAPKGLANRKLDRGKPVHYKYAGQMSTGPGGRHGRVQSKRASYKPPLQHPGLKNVSLKNTVITRDWYKKRYVKGFTVSDTMYQDIFLSPDMKHNNFPMGTQLRTIGGGGGHRVEHVKHH